MHSHQQAAEPAGPDSENERSLGASSGDEAAAAAAARRARAAEDDGPDSMGEEASGSDEEEGVDEDDDEDYEAEEGVEWSEGSDDDAAVFGLLNRAAGAAHARQVRAGRVLLGRSFCWRRSAPLGRAA